MGDTGDYFRDLKAIRYLKRRELGIDCPLCQKIQPKRIPTILLPGQRCKVCGYRDPRQRAN